MNMERIRRKALRLPVDGVAPDMIRLLPQDDAHDHIKMQHNATPVAVTKNVEEAIFIIEMAKVNAVVCEKNN